MNKILSYAVPDTMPFVPVPKDLTKVKTKLALNMTKRQLICFGLAAAVGVPVYLLTRTSIGNELAVIIMIVLMMPFFFLAMFEKNGQPAEKILRNYVRARFWPQTRTYKTNNIYKYLHEEGQFIAAEKTKKPGKTPKRKRNTSKKK